MIPVAAARGRQSGNESENGGLIALDVKELEASVLKLPLAERAALVERLIESLDVLDDTESEQLWVEEAERRYQAYKQDRLSRRSAADTIQDARARIR